MDASTYSVPVTFLQRLAGTVTSTDWVSVSVTRAVRVAVVVTVALSLTVNFGTGSQYASVALGALFAAFADPGGSYRHRASSLLVGSVAMICAVLIGGLISDNVALHLAVAVAWAFGAGLLCFTGPRGAMIGVLSLVLVSAYSGEPVLHRAGLALNSADVGAFTFGIALMAFTITVPWLLRRATGARSQLAVFFRGLARSVRAGRMDMWSSIHADHLRSAVVEIGCDEHTGSAAQFFTGITNDSAELRVALLGLAAYRGPESASANESSAFDAYLDALALVTRDIGHTLVWRIRRRSLIRAMVALEAAYARCMVELAPQGVGLVTAATVPLRHLVETVVGPWPLGPGSGVRLPRWRRPPRLDIRTHLVWSDPFLRHAVRLSMCIAAAVTIGYFAHFPHSYWIAVTVAWISKPGAGDTTIRVIARVAGTMLGIVVVIVVAWAIPLYAWDTVPLIGLAVVVVVGFLVPNYAIAMVGFTTFILLVFSLSGDPVDATSLDRLVATLIGGAIVVPMSLLWPLRQRTPVCDALRSLMAALAAAVSSVEHPPGSDSGSGAGAGAGAGAGHSDASALYAALADTQSAAAVTLAIASHEPGSHHRLHAGDAERILDDLNQLAANIVEWATTNCAPDGDATYRSMERSLATIVTQLDSLDRSGRVAHRNVGAAGVGLEKLDDVAAVLNAYV